MSSTTATVAQLPTSAYVVVGMVVVANLGTIFAFAKSMLKAAEDRGAMKTKMEYFEKSMDELKKDINAAFEKIRSIK